MTLDFDAGTPAVVLKLDHNVLHHGGLGVIRSLGRAGIPVFAVHEHPLAPAAHSRYLHGRFLWNPPPSPDPEPILAGLIRLAERIGRASVLIPTDDAGAILLAEHGEPLRRWFHFPTIDATVPRTVAGKYSLAQVCRRLDIATADATLARSVEEADAFVDRVGLPVVVKLPEPWEGAGGTGRSRLRSTTVVRRRRELADTFDHAAGATLMLQEYIPGGPGHDWFFHGYCDESSQCVAAFTGLKERSYPPHAGLTSFGRSVANERLRDEVARLLRRVSYRGIMDLDLRYDRRDDKFKLLDFNPRLGAQFRLFTTAAGVDVVRAAHLHLTGRAVPCGDALSERRFVVENCDSMAALAYVRRGELSLRTWLASLRRVDELAWFAADDLVPFGLMCLRTVGRAVSRPLRRGRPTVRRRTEQPAFRPGRAIRLRRPEPPVSLSAHTTTSPRIANTTERAQ